MADDTREAPGPDDPETGVPPLLEDGLAAGFGPPPAAAEGPSPSVLEQLAHTSGVQPRIALRDEPSRTPSRLLKPLGPNAVQWLSTEGKYQVQGEIARGGVGVVLKGHDVDLGRDVAMKVLHEKYLGNPDLVQRFVEEAQIGGQLQHPGIVPVYDLGLSGERPYFTMKLIKGRTLAALFEELSGREGGADRRRLLGIFEQVCQTMAYAHARGVIHRDLKPANVMVGAFGEVQVVDWGMGKVLSSGGIADEARSRSRSAASVIETVRSQPGSGSTHSIVGSVMGTPAYMPPEQANGDVERMDERSDVFSLGAILCEILTGEPPYVGSSEERIVLAARARLEPCLERLAASGADEALRELCMDCLRPAPAARPSHAGIVAERIAAHLAAAEERVHQAEIRAAAENARAGAARRSQRLTLALAASVLVTVIGGAGGAWWVERAARARQEAASQRVTRALDEVGGLLVEAHASGAADLAPWDRVAAAADRAVELAASRDVPEGRAREAREMLARITRERAEVELEAGQLMREERLFETLGRIRVPPDEGIRGDDWPSRDAERRDHEYAAAFADYFEGTPIEEGSMQEAIDALSRSEHHVAFATALDHWALVRDMVSTPDDPEAKSLSSRLREIAGRVDDENPWRSDLRALLPRLRESGTALSRLVEQTDLAVLPEASIELLGEALWSMGAEDQALEVYRRGRELHPGDFGICMRLAIMLWRLEEQPMAEILEVLRIANALRPDVREVQHLRVIALRALGRHEEERRVCEMLLSREPDSLDWLQHYAWALESLFRWDEVVEASRRRIAAVDPESPYAANHRAGAQRNLGEALERLGRLDEALDVYERGRELVEQYRQEHRGDPSSLDQYILDSGEEFAERIAMLERRSDFEEILREERRASSLGEWVEAASFATRTGRYALAAQTYGLVFLDFPGECDYDARYSGVCAAALCGAGRGRDADLLDGATRTEWRQQARAWLQAELAAERDRARVDRASVVGHLDWWRRDVDLAGIRDEPSLAELSPAERNACRELWSEVEVLLEDLRDRN